MSDKYYDYHNHFGGILPVSGIKDIYRIQMDSWTLGDVIKYRKKEQEKVNHICSETCTLGPYYL